MANGTARRPGQADRHLCSTDRKARDRASRATGLPPAAQSTELRHLDDGLRGARPRRINRERRHQGAAAAPTAQGPHDAVAPADETAYGCAQLAVDVVGAEHDGPG